MRFANKVKADRAARILYHYQTETGSSVVDGDALTDLLTDLRHWAEVERVPYLKADAAALGHFAAELSADE